MAATSQETIDRVLRNSAKKISELRKAGTKCFVAITISKRDVVDKILTEQHVTDMERLFPSVGGPLREQFTACVEDDKIVVLLNAIVPEPMMSVMTMTMPKD